MYEFSSNIRYSECAPDSHLSLHALVNYFQDCAVGHACSVDRGPDTWRDEHYGWMVTIWQIRIKRYPKLGEVVRVRTQPYRFRGFEADRNIAMFDEDGEMIALADSRWIYFDTEAGRPIRIPEIEITSYGVDPEIPLDVPKLQRHIKTPCERACEQRTIYSDGAGLSPGRDPGHGAQGPISETGSARRPARAKGMPE